MASEEVFNKVGLLFSDNKAVITNKFRLHSEKSVHSNYVKNMMYQLTFCCNDNKIKIISSKIIEYFNNYKLKTSKKESFRI